jgi:quercetin dioxygenase-like cupin family protein/5-methylcytosine-specific restriction endonuclease McrA
VDCVVCGTTVERAPNSLTGDRVFCSDECHYDWLSAAFTGEGHPNWAGGDVGPYGQRWAGVRRDALERNGHTCVLCETDADDLGRNRDVHRFVPVRWFVAAADRDRTDARRLANVVTLCPACHRGVEASEETGANYTTLPPLSGDMSDTEDTPAVVRGDDAEYEPVDAAEGLAKGVLVGEAEGAPNFAMRRFELRENAEVPSHTNEVEHVQYVLAGEYTVTVEGESHAVEPGDSLYIPAGAVHSYTNDGDREGAFLCVVPHGEDDIQLLEEGPGSEADGGEAAADGAGDGGGGAGTDGAESGS